MMMHPAVRIDNAKTWKKQILLDQQNNFFLTVFLMFMT
jgi:hypothetical protein